MNAHYRIVFFISDPFVGSRYPIGALLKSGDGVALVRADGLPRPDAVGGALALEVFHGILNSLSGWVAFDRLPSSAGPHAYLDAERGVPPGVPDPVAWMKRILHAAAPAPTTPSSLRTRAGAPKFALLAAVAGCAALAFVVAAGTAVLLKERHAGAEALAAADMRVQAADDIMTESLKKEQVAEVAKEASDNVIDELVVAGAAKASAVLPPPGRRLYVYLGRCSRGRWRKSYFAPLPTDCGGADQTPLTVTATRDVSASSGLPKRVDGVLSLGLAVRLIKKDEPVVVRRMVPTSLLPGPDAANYVWGEIVDR